MTEHTRCPDCQGIYTIRADGRIRSHRGCKVRPPDTTKAALSIIRQVLHDQHCGCVATPGKHEQVARAILASLAGAA